MSDSILVRFGGHESSSFNFSWLLNLVDETVTFIIYTPTFALYIKMDLLTKIIGERVDLTHSLPNNAVGLSVFLGRKMSKCINGSENNF